MVCICGATLAIAGLLGMLMLYLVYLAMHVGEPVRPRAAIESSSTTSALPMYTSLRPGRYTTAVPAECLRQPVFHECRANDSFPAADRFDDWRGHDGNASGRPWYFLRRSCFEWTPESFCLERSRAHFTKKKKCARLCEKGTPEKRCTDHLRAPLQSNCTPITDELVGPQRWFFDPLARRCREWRNVCVRPAFPSQEACTRRCRLVRRINRG